MANPNNLTGIGHPGNPNWRLPDFDQSEALIRAQLEPRFANCGEDMEALVEAIVLATMRSESHRQAHEKGNVGRLTLSPEDIKRYVRISGNPDYVGEAIYWLGHLMHNTLDAVEDKTFKDEDKKSKEEYEKRKRIGFELGGNLQFGNWETTGPLDAMARTIPARLDAIDKDVSMKIYGPRRSEDSYEALDIKIEFDERTLTSYLLWPRFLPKTVSGKSFDHAILRRRRAVADINIPGVRPIEIYKDSNMVVVPSQMDAEERAELYNAYAARGFNTKATKNSPEAEIAGKAAERGINSKQNETKDIVVVGAHYVMKMFKDGRGMAQSLEA